MDTIGYVAIFFAVVLFLVLVAILIARMVLRRREKKIENAVPTKLQEEVLDAKEEDRIYNKRRYGDYSGYESDTGRKLYPQTGVVDSRVQGPTNEYSDVPVRADDQPVEVQPEPRAIDSEPEPDVGTTEREPEEDWPDFS